jgi:hypothetical protein
MVLKKDSMALKKDSMVLKRDARGHAPLHSPLNFLYL